MILKPVRPVQRIMVLLSAGLVAAACGRTQVSAGNSAGSGESSAARAALAAAHDATLAAGSYHVTYDGEMSGTPDQGGGTIVTGTGTFNATSERSSLQMTLTASDQQDAGSVPAGLQHPNLVVDGDTVYLSLPPSVAPRGKAWARFSSSGMFDGGSNPDDTGPYSLSDSVGLADPAHALIALSALGTTATVVGQESVRGVPATHYKTTIDPPKMGAAAGVVASPSPGDPFGSLDVIPGQLPVDIWLDGRGRVLRMMITYDFASANHALMQFLNGFGSAFGTALPATPVMTFTVENYDFGTPAAITDPAPALVAGVADVPTFDNFGS
ncbi:MAG TPA: hypothetical protein VFW71_04105 [Actinomycetota bacterium]|nr:hypothetical protein [Actinomycetota bacterium]